MKKTILSIVLSIVLFVVIYGITNWIVDYNVTGGVHGENIKVTSADESTVYFYFVCPSCNHVSPGYNINLSKGEDHSTVHVCEKCFKVYNATIER